MTAKLRTDLVREGEEAFARVRDQIEEHGPLPCKVSHPDAGGRCERPAAMRVYGLPFCEVHGAEVKAGALEEAYYDASNFFERLDNPHVLPPSPLALQALRETVSRLRAEESRALGEEERDAALLRAYPLAKLRERMDGDAVGFDYRNPEGWGTPVDWNYRARMLIHKLMRIVYEEKGPGYLLEDLEEYREMVSAQLAFALADLEERYPKPEVDSIG